MKKIGVSACLVGINSKYNGKNNYNEAVINYLKDKEYITICPEVLGGLSIPRLPSEIINNKVINIENNDVSKQFYDGANKALDILKKENVEILILKANSPSCGYQSIYDGSFTNTLIAGNGIFTKLALQNNFKIYTEKDIEKIMNIKKN